MFKLLKNAYLLLRNLGFKLRFLFLLSFGLVSALLELGSVALFYVAVSFSYPVLIFGVQLGQNTVLLIFAITFGLNVVLRLVCVWVTQMLARDVGRSLVDLCAERFVETKIARSSFTSSASFISTVATRVTVFVREFFLPLLQIFFGIATSTVLIYFVLDEFGIIALCFLILVSLFYIGIFFLIKPKLNALSFSINDGINRVYADLGNVFDVAEFAIRHQETKTWILDKLSKSDFQWKNSLAYVPVYAAAPRTAIEFILIGVGSVLFISAMSEYEAEQVLAVSSVLGIVGLRLVPLVQQIFKNWSLIKSATETTRELFQAIGIFFDHTRGKESSELYVENSRSGFHLTGSFSLPNSTILVVKNFSFERGRVNIITGPSGVGKSSFLKELQGVFSEGVKTELVDQNLFCVEGSILDNLLLGRSLDAELVNTVSSLCFTGSRLDLHARVEPDGVNLSGGEVQRISIARALLSNPDVLMLDESTGQLDMDSGNQIIDSIISLFPQICLVLVSHRDVLISSPVNFFVIDGCEIRRRSL